LGRVPWWITIPGIVAAATVALYFWLPIDARPLAFQALIDGSAVGSIYILGASGLSLTYGVKKFANFAHGDMMTVGAYMAYTAMVILGKDMVSALLLAMLSVALLGIFLELSIFRRLEQRGAIAALIASVGVSLIIQNVVGLFYLGDVRNLPIQIPQSVPVGTTGLAFNWVKDGVTIGLAIGLMVFLHFVLKHTTLGRAMRACADDLDLARASGINTHNVILWTWGISGALAGLAGVLLALWVNVYPPMGFFILLFIFSAVILGGIGSPYGAMVGGLLIGIVQKLSSVFFGQLSAMNLIENGASYDAAGAFVVLVLVLLIKPEGIMGKRRPTEGRRRRVWARRAPKEGVSVGD